MAVSYEGDTCIVQFDATPGLANPRGTLHGGMLATAMDISMGHLLQRTVGAGATVEMKVQYMAAVTDGPVRCTGSFLRRGPLHLLHAVARNRRGRRVRGARDGHLARVGETSLTRCRRARQWVRPNSLDQYFTVMPGLDPGIHGVGLVTSDEGLAPLHATRPSRRSWSAVVTRVKPWHDGKLLKALNLWRPGQPWA